MNLPKNKNWGACLVAPALMAAMVSADASTLVDLGHAAGKQCVATDVNDSNDAIGACSPLTGESGPVNAFVAPVGAMTELILPTLVAGQSCVAVFVSNGRKIGGSCIDNYKKSNAVRWDAASPTAAPQPLSPVAGLLGLNPGVRAYVSGSNQANVFYGGSVDRYGAKTAALWLAGSTSAIQVSNSGDNCSIASITDIDVAGNRPLAALNCPNDKGTSTAKAAQSPGPLLGLVGLAGQFTLTDLLLPTNGSYCTVIDVNENKQFAGSCHIRNKPETVSVFWPSSTSPPISFPGVPGLSANLDNGAIALNNPGEMLVGYRDASGFGRVAKWSPVSSTVIDIPPLAGGASVSAGVLPDAGPIPINSENADENVEAAEWTLALGTVSDGFEGGGKVSVFTASSESGSFRVGVAENGGHTMDAVRGQ